MKHLSLAKPHLIVMVGIPGSGKSFFAEKFANTFGAPYICEKKIAALAPGGEHAELALLQLDELLKTKQSIILDGSSHTRTERATLSKRAHDRSYDVLYIWVQTDQGTAKARATSAKKTSDYSSITAEEYGKALKRFTAPNVAEKPLVISGKHTYASQAKVVLKKLSTPRAEISTTHSISAIRPERPKSRNIIIR